MERVTFKNSRDLTLVGQLSRATSQSVIILCHGFTSDKSSRGRFDRLAGTYQRSGYNVLAFDFSGCGESADDSLTLAKQVDDLKAAINFVKARGYTTIGLHGHSLGTLVCLKGFSPEIKTMVLTGAATGPMKYNWDEYYSKEQMQELRDKGYITEYKTEGIRRTVIIDKQMLADFETVDQAALLKPVNCPVLIIHGDNDDEERRLWELSKQAMQWLPDTSKLVRIEGANHSFLEHFSIVEELANKWFLKHLEQ